MTLPPELAKQQVRIREVAAAFGLRSTRSVRAACRWAADREERDAAFAALLHEVGRVLPRT